MRLTGFLLNGVPLAARPRQTGLNIWLQICSEMAVDPWRMFLSANRHPARWNMREAFSGKSLRPGWARFSAENAINQRSQWIVTSPTER